MAAEGPHWDTTRLAGRVAQRTTAKKLVRARLRQWVCDAYPPPTVHGYL